MRTPIVEAALILVLLTGCAGNKPSEVLDETTGVTVGALDEPIEFVENARDVGQVNSKRNSFAYIGPVEWDRMGEITYALWIHVAPGNDRQVADIHSDGAVTLELDDGPMRLAPMDPPSVGRGPYRPVASWGQTSYFALDVGMLKRLAASQKLAVDVRSTGNSTVDFLPSHDTHATLTHFMEARGITAD